MKIAFVWQGITGRYGVWKDGLWAAMKIIEKNHWVTYHEPTDAIPEDAVVLYWEAPCTINGKDAANYIRIRELKNKKALLFAGGPIKSEWIKGFDHIFVESKINDEELNALDFPHSVAFGINEEIFKPYMVPKVYVGIHAGTCASWKRQWLLGEALGPRGCVVGRYQETDPSPFDRCKVLGTVILPEQTPEQLVMTVNSALICVQTSDFHGGGQRATLEAMACNIPVLCMSDSPKNMEYVTESGAGLITEPNKEDIAKAIGLMISTDYGTRGRDYIMSKWTAKHYADNLLKWINQ